MFCEMQSIYARDDLQSYQDRRGPDTQEAYVQKLPTGPMDYDMDS